MEGSPDSEYSPSNNARGTDAHTEAETEQQEPEDQF
jgi:hypothetical protein